MCAVRPVDLLPSDIEGLRTKYIVDRNILASGKFGDGNKLVTTFVSKYILSFQSDKNYFHFKMYSYIIISLLSIHL